MKQHLPYNVLLALTIALTGLMIYYNLVARDTFAVTVAYKIPGVPQPEPVQTASGPPSPSHGEENVEDDEDDYSRDSFHEEKTLTSVTFPLDINRATEEELRFIPQVGNVMAQRIVQYRDVIGGYTSLEQLKDIKGVADASFEKISAYLIIAGQESEFFDMAEESFSEIPEENENE